MEWYLQVLKNYAGFSGRARRKEYWMFVLFNVIISMVIGFVSGFLAGATGVSSIAYLSTLYGLAVLVPSIAVGIRRLHDIGKAGVWYLIAFVPIVGGILLLVWFCKEGDPGTNAYGDSPK